MKLRPLIAAMLNMALPGVGYIFIGKRRLFGWFLFSATVFSLAARNYGFKSSELISNNKVAALFELISIVLITISFGIDAYMQAKES